MSPRSADERLMLAGVSVCGVCGVVCGGSGPVDGDLKCAHAAADDAVERQVLEHL